MPHRSSGSRECSITSESEALQDGQIVALCAVLPVSGIEDLTLHNLSLVGAGVAGGAQGRPDTSTQALRMANVFFLTARAHGGRARSTACRREVVGAAAAAAAAHTSLHPSVLGPGPSVLLCSGCHRCHVTLQHLNTTPQNINSWVAIADSCTKSRALRKLCIKECVFTEGAFPFLHLAR